jgi:hypothetical protein
MIFQQIIVWILNTIGCKSTNLLNKRKILFEKYYPCKPLLRKEFTHIQPPLNIAPVILNWPDKASFFKTKALKFYRQNFELAVIFLNTLLLLPTSLFFLH